MAERNAMKELSNSVCIVGVDESDEIGTLPHKSQLALHLEAMTNAVRDADSRSRMWMASYGGQHSPALLGEALGITPRYVDGTRWRVLLHDPGRACRRRLASSSVQCGRGLARREWTLGRGGDPEPRYEHQWPV